jgi:Tfp pilus assembly protein PilF
MKKILITLGGVVLVLLVLGWVARGKISTFFSAENRAKDDLGIAIEHLNNGKPEAALRMLGGALKLKPDYAEAHYYVAKAFEMQGGPAEALIEEYKKAIELKPNYVEARQALGLVYFGKGDHEGARREFEKIIEIEPDNVVIYNNLGHLHETMKDYKKAEEYFRRAIDLMPDYDFALNNLGEMYFRQGRWSESKVVLERALSVNPKSGRVHYFLAQIAEKQKDKPKAIEHWQKAIELGLKGDELNEAQERLKTLKK